MPIDSDVRGVCADQYIKQNEVHQSKSDGSGRRARRRRRATGRRSTTTRITGLLLANVARNLQFACARHLIHIKRTERKTNCSSLGLSAAAISDRGSLNRAEVVAF
jgi:hypothetical protein